MSVTLDDKAITRGYALRDEVIIQGKKIYQLKQKLERLLEESSLINLRPPLNTVADFNAIIRDMVTTCRDLYGQEVFHDLRNTHRLLILISGGGGDFSIALNRANTQVYMAIYSESRESYQNEACIEDEELKNLNFNVKSNNYLVRSYIASEAKSKGGYLAVEADKEGYLLEGAVATIALLLKNGDFIVPPFDRRLAGTTAIKIMDYIQKEVLSSDLLPDGYLKQIVRREILISEAKDECVEIMFLGGEECVPILEWDGEPV